MEHKTKFSKEDIEHIKNFFICSLIFLIVILLYLAFMSPLVSGFQIIPEDPYENQTLTICSKIFNNSNQTLDCCNFFNDIRNKNQTTYINNSYNFNEILDDKNYTTSNYISERFNDFDHLQPDKIRQIIDEKIENLRIEQEEYIRSTLFELNKTIIHKPSLDEIKEENRHLEKMEELKLLNSQEEEPSQEVQEEPDQQFIPYEPRIIDDPEPKGTGNFFGSIYFFFAIALLGGGYLLWKNKDKLKSRDTIPKKQKPDFSKFSEVLQNEKSQHQPTQKRPFESLGNLRPQNPPSGETGTIRV